MIIDLGPLTIKLDVLVVQIINVAILFYFFKKLFGDTLIEEIAKRRAMTHKLEKAEQEYDALIIEATVKKEAIIAEAMAHKKSIVTESIELAKQEGDKVLAKATAEATLLLDKAAKDVANEKKTLEQSFEIGIKKTALVMVKKLFSSNKQASDIYVAGLVDEFSTSYKS